MSRRISATAPAAPADDLAQIRVVAALIVIAALVAFSPGFAGPFIFDDITSIVENPTIRHLWPIGPVLSPPYADGATVGGRPFLNFTFALNHAISGTNVWSYHALNLLIHAAAGLTLFGIVRRSIDGTRPALHAIRIAGAVALLWTIHPVQTESVTYIVQRAESLNGFLYLLTLYAFIRATYSMQPHRWFALSVFSCLIGMATKEVMATAPLIVLLYDRCFVSGTFGRAFRSRRGYYAALSATWLLLAALMLTHHGRGNTVGFDVGVTSWEYAVTQLRAVVHYLRLSVLPHPLVLDHGGLLSFQTLGMAAVHALPVLALLAIVAFALQRWPRWGFIGAWFFIILAPSSSLVPLLDSIFEHRMYLPLAAPLVMGVLAFFFAVGPRATALLAAIALSWVALTVSRNGVYRSEVGIWQDTIAKRPRNARAHFELGVVLLRNGRLPPAIENFRAAIRIRPEYVEAQHNLGAALLESAKWNEALTELQLALRMNPTAKTHFAAARALTELGRIEEAVAHYGEALRLKPDYPDAFNNRANLRLQGGDAATALADYESALRLQPDHVNAHLNAALALLQLRRVSEALAQGEAAVRLKPESAAARLILGNVLLEAGRLEEATNEIETALRLQPDFPAAAEQLSQLRKVGREAPSGAKR